MSNGAGSTGRALGVAAILACAAVGLLAQAPAAPASASATKAKELVTLLAEKKVEGVTAKDPEQASRFVAALLVPKVQLLVVSAVYSRPMDMEYRLYNKDFMNAYLDLKSSALASERVFVDDALGDGLVALPGKNLAHDSITTGADTIVFNGDFADPRRKNQKKISQDDYMKAFGDADQRYARLLGILVDQLKKVSQP